MHKLMLLLLVLTFGLLACNGSITQEQRETGVRSRSAAFAKAEAQIPQPIPSNFLARKMLVKYVERQDVPDHPFYVYVLGETGNVIGYYVSQAAPVNVCVFLSSTEDVYTSSNGVAITTAPSLDGIFYGGAGSTSSCNGWFIFDAASDALIIVYGSKMFVADQPLKLDAKPITVAPIIK